LRQLRRAQGRRASGSRTHMLDREDDAEALARDDARQGDERRARHGHERDGDDAHDDRPRDLRARERVRERDEVEEERARAHSVDAPDPVRLGRCRELSMQSLSAREEGSVRERERERRRTVPRVQVQTTSEFLTTRSVYPNVMACVSHLHETCARNAASAWRSSEAPARG